MDTIRNARDALDDAQEAGAREYATSAFLLAEASMAALAAELDGQARRLRLLRSYERADSLANAALEAAREAILVAEANKELTHRRVQSALSATRASISRSWDSLRELAARPGGGDELAATEAELIEAARALSEATALFHSRRYLEAETVIAPARASALDLELQLADFRGRAGSL